MPIELTLELEVRDGLGVYPLDSARRAHVDAFFTDRFGGESTGPYEALNLGQHVGDDPANVVVNRRRVARAIGVGDDELVIVRQVHGSRVVNDDEANPDTEADAVVSASAHRALVILVADCLPLLFTDPDTGHFAVAHAGWRGLHAGVITETLRHFTTPGTIDVAIGPSISAEAYQVGPEVARHFSAIESAVLPDGGDRSRLDLRRVAVHQLTTAGVEPSRITIARQTTDGGETFFSDRAKRPCGRFALVARRVVA